MNLGFHTISLLLHDETTALQELASIGYQSIAVRPRLSGLNPYAKHFVEGMLRFASCANRTDVQVIWETNAPLLCRASLSGPDLSESAEAKAWIEICILAAQEYLGDQATETVVVIESGAATRDESVIAESTEEAELELLSFQLNSLLRRASDAGVRLAIRPRLGNVIAKVTHFQRLQQWLTGDDPLYLAADTAQMMLNSEFPIGQRLSPIASSLACVFLTDPDTTSPTASVRSDAALLPGPVDLKRVVQSLARQEIHVPMIVQIDGQSEKGLCIAQEAWTKLSY